MLKFIVISLFILILISLFSSMFFLIKDKGQKRRVVNTLFIRIILSIILFIILIILYQMGYIEPNSL
ncbi:MAG: DUF2909 domain-containing protein [Pseudomonadota bacterium]|nr:DUF2909 domain-containing protein [Pseudomonadota bacterium]